MKWIKLTDEYANTIKHMAKRKIRLEKSWWKWHKKERYAIWDANENCFFWDNGETAIYMDEPERPTHILVNG
jgi:hypothetical protein